MADVKDFDPGVDPLTEEDKGSLAYKLAHADDSPDPEAEAAAQAEREAVELAEREAARSEAETPEEKATREAAEAAAANLPKFEPKHKTWEETEKARVEAERTMHEANTKAAEEVKAKETLQKELDELKANPPEKKEPAKEVTEEERDAQLEAVASAANEQAMAEIAELDDQDPDYRKLVAKAWGKANAKIIKAARQTPISQADIDKLIDQRWDAKDTAAKAAKAEADLKTAGQQAAKEVEDYCKEHGLPVDDPEKAEYDLFDAAERKLPVELQGKGATPEVKEWIANYIRQRTGKVVEQSEAERQAALVAQKKNAVLGKGVTVPKTTTPTQPRTMNDIIGGISP
jgi:hypothetical protein